MGRDTRLLSIRGEEVNELENANRIIEGSKTYARKLDARIDSQECIPPRNHTHQAMLNQVIMALKNTRSDLHAILDKAIK